jgi:nucleolar protein 15
LDPEDDDPADEGAAFQAGQDVGEIPKIVKPAKSDKKSDGERGVVYIGRIPHGFYEHEMRQYFKQFGPISRLRLSRNKKTGASKHFAFIEFAEASTAEVVAKTMNNYLLFGHILKCTVIPKETVHEDLFKGANRRYKKVPWNKMAGRQLEQGHTEADWNKRVSQEQKKRNKTVSKLKALGYEFDAPELKEAPSAPVVEEEQPEVKAIEVKEATNGNTEKNDEDTAAEPAHEKTISAPKTKSGRSGKGKKAKA